VADNIGMPRAFGLMRILTWGLSEASSLQHYYSVLQRLRRRRQHYFFFDQHPTAHIPYDFWIEGTFCPAGDYTPHEN